MCGEQCALTRVRNAKGLTGLGPQASVRCLGSLPRSLAQCSPDRPGRPGRPGGEEMARRTTGGLRTREGRPATQKSRRVGGHSGSGGGSIAVLWACSALSPAGGGILGDPALNTLRHHLVHHVEPTVNPASVIRTSKRYLAFAPSAAPASSARIWPNQARWPVALLARCTHRTRSEPTASDLGPPCILH